MRQESVPAVMVVHVDVTDTIDAAWRAGIQRVVCKLIEHIPEADPRVEVVPVAWFESKRCFRTLTGDEDRRLRSESSSQSAATAPARVPARIGRVARAVDAARPLLGRLRRDMVGLLAAAHLEEPLRRLRRAVLARTRDRSLVPLAVALAPGSVLLELDTVWNNTLVDRDRLYCDLRAGGVHLAVMIYDLLPQQHPEWFESSLVEVSTRTLTAQARHAELVLAISEDTAASFRRWAAESSLTPPTPSVVALGADAARTSRPATTLPEQLVGVSYILVVGTIEPRKNHATLLDAFERLSEAHPEVHLVIVGRPGWNNEVVLDRLGAHPLLDQRVHWFRRCGDDLLDTLYTHARVVAVPSITEGYGLPVIEALAHGVPVVSSDRGALVEAGAGLVDHVSPTDPDGWSDALERHMVDEDHLRARRAAAASFVAPAWASTGAEVAGLLLGTFGPPNRR